MADKKYILSIDQSTQGTKMLLFDQNGTAVTRVDRPHRQIVNELGWVSHDMEEVYDNIISGLKEILAKTDIHSKEIAAVGISNQRETTVAFGPSGKPFCPAIVWQCGRAANIVKQMEAEAETVRRITCLPLSPFFPAAKMRWLLENDCMDIDSKDLHIGTVDSYLVYRLTGGKVFATDASNASRTQLMDLDTINWSQEHCTHFRIPAKVLPEIMDSNGNFGETDFEGVLDYKIPIRCVMGDSHGALYGQHCHESGMMKTTYGTGSSMMLNTGKRKIASRHGLASSLAWRIDGVPSYVLEGNINYTGAVISWLKDDLGLLRSAKEVNELCLQANPEDSTIFVPAFTGLSAPYWNDSAKAAVLGMSRTTKKAEFAKAAVESIAQQVTDVFEAMVPDFGENIKILRADGGPTGNPYLMQFQSNMAGCGILVPDAEELSAIGVAYLAGITAGIYDKAKVFQNISYREYRPDMPPSVREKKRNAWKEAIRTVIGRT